MRKIILVMLLIPLVVMGHEGMWLPCFVSKKTQQIMHDMGLRLSPSQLYSATSPSLTNSIVSFGGFCSGVVVSPDGLVFTNHHCGFDAIQQHSAPEHDYLKNGFVASSFNEELPNPDLFVSFLVRMEDVTKRILKDIPQSASEGERSMIIDSLSSLIADEAVAKDTLLRAEVTPYYGGNQYYLSVYKDYYDVRLVFAPPSSIGKFGGDTDNWVWPRHTGDFSVFRIYADKNNQPAQYSKENVPYHPDYYAPVSLGGYDQGSFCMTFGYPGNTDRFMSSFGIEERMNIDNAAMIDVRTIKQAIWKDAMESSDALRIKYSSKYARSSNYWKNSIGMNKAIKELGIIEKKKELEKQLNEWIRKDPYNRDKYINVLTGLQLNYQNRRAEKKAMTYFGECFANGPEILEAAVSVLNFDSGADKADIDKSVRKLKELYADIDIDVDKKVFKALLKLYRSHVDKEYLPKVYETIDDEFKGNSDDFVDDLYRRSLLRTTEGLERVAANDTTYVLFKDPAASFAIDMLVKFYEFNQDMSAIDMDIEKYERLLTEAVCEMEKDKEMYPDANSTMRMSFGLVGSYSPRDGIEYDYYTTIKGIAEKVKEYKGDSDFDLLPSVADFLSKGDYGRYAAKDGDMNVCFITDNDITGGNSGSGMFNGRGELIGLAFDGNWEAMSSDIKFEKSLQKCIGVDIRYMLYVIEKYGNAKRLIDELKIVE